MFLNAPDVEAAIAAAHRLPHIRDLLQRHELMFAPGPQALR